MLHEWFPHFSLNHWENVWWVCWFDCVIIAALAFAFAREAKNKEMRVLQTLSFGFLMVPLIVGLIQIMDLPSSSALGGFSSQTYNFLFGLSIAVAAVIGVTLPANAKKK